MTPEGSRSAGLERFREYLRACNLPVTSQRLRIAEILFGTHRHVSADEILAQLHAEGSPIGKATVYRTLDLLLRAGLIREHEFGEGFRRYEPRPTRPRHEHLVCTRCGKVIEFESQEVERIEAEVSALHAFRPSHHRLEVYGHCEDCR
ncbi:MAG TPA: Fur family transcriptional regulator [Gemmatimonadota bacterium]|nr:Fur family transcriptional regulator [Gemmatimonadota bacterium]